MYVRLDDLKSLRFLSSSKFLAVDTETTGLNVHGVDRLFSVIIADAESAWYFDFRGQDTLGPEGRDFLIDLFSTGPRTIFMHNAKFDIGMLEKFGARFSLDSTFHDTAALARLHMNQIEHSNLDFCGKYFLGEGKYSPVDAYLKEHKCTHYDVPNELLVPYGEQDALLTYKLGMHQIAHFEKLDMEAPATWPKVTEAVRLQYALTPVVYAMEKVGVKIDNAYCMEAMDYEGRRMAAASQEFEAITGFPFKTSSKLFKDVFATELAGLRVTDKGNPSFDKNSMKAIDTPLSRVVNSYRDAKARLNYFAGFLDLVDDRGMLHSNLNETGAATLRFTSSKPNLQNMKRPDEDAAAEAYPVRRAIIPPSPDYCMVMIDYSQQELRLMLDYAGALGLIAKILGGEDAHQATAVLAGITRNQAKQVNFAIIYGTGLKAMAAGLGVSIAEATRIRDSIFIAAPEIKYFIAGVKAAAKRRGYVYAWNGTRLHLPRHPEGRDMSYVMVNHVIQGGSAVITKRAMVACADALSGYTRSYLALSIHDELIFMVHKAELGIVPYLKDIMERAYPHKKLPMLAEVSHSWVSLGDKVKGLPTPQASTQ